MNAGLYHNKYRVSSARAQWWDYAWHGAYFVTICTKDKEHSFGEIKHDKMELSNAGILADVFWHEIKQHSKHVELDAFVVMPNHIHGILIMDGLEDATDNIETRQSDLKTRQSDVETRHALSLPEPEPKPKPKPEPETIHKSPSSNELDDLSKTFGEQRFRNQGKNTVSSIVGSYKSAVTKHIHRLGLKAEWQTRFYDHIIKDDVEFNRIVDYIEHNVIAWEKDKFYK